MAGSFGVSGILPIYKNLIKSKIDFQTVLITGKNKKLYDELSDFIKSERDKNSHVRKTKLIYFTDEVYKFMQVSDLIITKPGGMTVSEALISGLPIAAFDAIPGQEEENAEFLIKNNMGVRISKDKNCLFTIENLLMNKEQLNSIKNSCNMFKEVVSNKSIYNLIKKLAESRKCSFAAT